PPGSSRWRTSTTSNRSTASTSGGASRRSRDRTSRMTLRAVRTAAAFSAALGLVGAGCGAGSEPLDRETAMQHAMNAVANEVADPGSSIYHHRFELRTADAYGSGGWLVRIADRTARTR